MRAGGYHVFCVRCRDPASLRQCFGSDVERLVQLTSFLQRPYAFCCGVRFVVAGKSVCSGESGVRGSARSTGSKFSAVCVAAPTPNCGMANNTQQYLEALTRERKINMDHSFIRQLQRTGIRLYVVSETLEASEEAVYEESTKADGGFMAKFYATLSAKGTRERNQGIVIPKGCTLAFRTILLHIRDGAWDLVYFQDEDEDHVVEDRQGYADDEKLEEVRTEVKKSCRIFSKLSPDLLLIILNTIKAVMTDENLLQELSQKMEEVLEENDGYELKTESPDLKELFSTLQQSPRHRLLQLAEGITYVLDALQELMEHQLLLLLESLERKIVSQQLKLVENLLKYDLEYEMEPFSVKARLLSFQHEEDQKLTIALVELSGVHLQEDGSAIPRDQPFESVAALFAALYALKLLSGSK
ncbi:gasdermin-A3-like [Zonotrichia albicollis]|uniref:gasdermin-A3-like n=1 Tax=Zonotrichia albicollis TaxID=44394 RepID=UPI003D80FD8D